MNKAIQTLTRGRLAREVGVNLETIRFYEDKGLLPIPDRNAAGYRQYHQGHARHLEFIKRAQELGFTLSEIKELLSLHALPNESNYAVKLLAEQKIESIAAKIRDLKKMQRALEQISSACDGHGTAHDCPILQALDGKYGKAHHSKGKTK